MEKMEKITKITNQLRNAPELEKVLIITADKEEINLIFESGTARTGQELLTAQKILLKNKIFNFIKSEKVELFTNEIKEIKFYIYD